MEFTTTERGARKLIKDGYIYVFKKRLANDISSWECELRRKGQCRATVKLEPTDEYICMLNEHTHPPSQTKCEVTQVKVGIKRRATETRDNARNILAVEVGNISQAAAVNLPSMINLGRSIRSQRQIRFDHPNPVAREAIPAIPLELTQTQTGEQFLIYDSGIGDNDRILIFGAPDELQLLRDSPHWFCDGTFKVSPGIFFQVYTIHAMVNGQVIPCIYALLPNKTEVQYNRLFRHVSDALNRENHPEDILTDFERAAINAAANVFDGTEIKGCFFHLCSNVWKRIQASGLQPRYNADPEFANTLRMLLALALVPEDDMIRFFEQYCDYARNLYHQDCDQVIDYFEETYVGLFRRNAPRRAPMFDQTLWNMFHRTILELPRTSNSVEGWHRSFQTTVSTVHPSFGRFLEALKQEQAHNRVQLLQALGGHPAPPQRRRYADNNQRLIQLVDNFQNMEPIQYLRSVAHNLGLH